MKKITAVLAVFLLTITTMPALHASPPPAAEQQRCEQCEDLPRLSHAVMAAAVWDLANVRERLRTNSLRVEDVQMAIASSMILQRHLDEIGYYKTVDAAILANRQRILDHAATEEDITTLHQHLLKQHASFTREDARAMLNVSRQEKELALHLIATEGSRESHTRAIHQLLILKAQLVARQNNTGTVTLARFGGNPCTVAHTVAATFGVGCLFGCAPCCGAAAVAELEACFCDLATEK